jgi:FKBP-type peptidyl-prolyl cis-trans isomerase FkpA
LNIFKTIGFGAVMPVILFPLLLFFVSCSERPENKQQTTNLHMLEDSVAAFNHQVVKTEIQEIDDFILRYHWAMNQTPTGLRYMIYQKGTGPSAKQGDSVTIKYRINLLNGDLVYESDDKTNFTFLLGKRNVTSGLEEGIMLMRRGSRAKLVVPSHLAFGVLGDLAKIPARAALVYDVELNAIIQPKK